MPQSPYQTIVYAPISDLESYRRSVNRYRAEYDNSQHNSYPVDEIVDLAGPLLEQIDFLEKKLEVKKSAFNKLDKSFTALNEEVDDLKGENRALDNENFDLKDENKALRDEVAALKNGANEDIVKDEDNPKEGKPPRGLCKGSADPEIVWQGEEAVKKAETNE